MLAVRVGLYRTNLRLRNCFSVIAIFLVIFTILLFRYPSTLNEEFVDETAEFINVKTNESLGEHSLKKFWDGFGCISKRLKDEKGQPAVIRLSGWPGNFGEEFKETLPNRSSEFLRTLPMTCYTGRSAPLNLAASLPDTFARYV